MMNQSDKTIIQDLAWRYAEIAALPIQEERKELWRRLNSLDPVRPMVMIDQVCWNEMDIDDAPNGGLTLRCIDPDCREYEDFLRKTLFQWKYFPVDMVVDDFIRVPKAITNTGFGITVEENVSVLDPTNSVVGHLFLNQFQKDEDLEKIRMPVISHDAPETARRMEMAHDLFDGIIDIKSWGADPYLSLWDPISTWMGVEGALYDLVDRPDFMHALVDRMTKGYLVMLDQLEEQGLLCEPQSLIHCTGAYTDELPAPGYDPQKPRTKDLWMFGLAQMFAMVSPKVFKEYEVDYASRICERFGLVYYGCCDPLDGKMDQVRMIPNVRKVSMSPWVNEEHGAAEIGGDFVYSRKPSPAMVAYDSFDPEMIREDLTRTKKICDRYGCPLELILKDISTVRYEPLRLAEWGRVAMEVVGSS